MTLHTLAIRAFLLSFLLGICTLDIAAQIKGQVVDKANLLPVEYAYISIQDTPIGVVANEGGWFELHIPLNHQGKNIIISRIGYCSDTIFTPDQSKVVQITLSQQKLSLAEATIKPINPLEILRKAIQKIPDNYSDNEVYLNAYYREMVNTDNVFVKYADAACKLYYSSYITPYNERKASSDFFYYDFVDWDKKKPFPQAKNIIPHQNDAVQILAIRKSNDFDKFINRWDFEEGLKKFDIAGGPLHITSADIVKHRKDMVDTATWKYYSFKLENILENGERRIYKIGFEPKRAREDAMWQGVIYIDEESYAFIEFEYSAAEKGKQYLREKHYEQVIDLRKNKTSEQVNKPIVKRIVEHTNQTVRISYAYYQGKWYLSHIRTINDFENAGDVFETISYSTFIDLYVNDIVANDVIPLLDEDTFNTNFYSYLYHYTVRYNPDFWKQYNTPVPSEYYKKALMDLEKDKSLQEQFRDN